MATTHPTQSSPTNRDAESNPNPQFSSTYPTEKGLKDLKPLLKPAGKWSLTQNGTGLERSFKFKGFKACWTFMDKISKECIKNKHHPEWSNVYNTAFVRWTTHRPAGLSELDTRMARICDEVGGECGELEGGEEGVEGGEEGVEGGEEGVEGVKEELVGRVVSEAGAECCVPKR